MVQTETDYYIFSSFSTYSSLSMAYFIIICYMGSRRIKSIIIGAKESKNHNLKFCPWMKNITFAITDPTSSIMFNNPTTILSANSSLDYWLKDFFITPLNLMSMNFFMITKIEGVTIIIQFENL